MKLRVTVDGTAFDVDVDILEGSAPVAAAAPAAPAAPAPAAPAAPAAAPAPAASPAPAAGGKTLPSPIPGTVVEINAKPGDEIAPNGTVVVIDAMKMNTPIAAPNGGKIKAILVNVGDAVTMNQPLVEFE